MKLNLKIIRSMISNINESIKKSISKFSYLSKKSLSRLLTQLIVKNLYDGLRWIGWWRFQSWGEHIYFQKPNWLKEWKCISWRRTQLVTFFKAWEFSPPKRRNEECKFAAQVNLLINHSEWYLSILINLNFLLFRKLICWIVNTVGEGIWLPMN
jgi:hypothetical protein